LSVDARFLTPLLSFCTTKLETKVFSKNQWFRSFFLVGPPPKRSRSASPISMLKKIAPLLRGSILTPPGVLKGFDRRSRASSFSIPFLPSRILPFARIFSTVGAHRTKLFSTRCFSHSAFLPSGAKGLILSRPPFPQLVTVCLGPFSPFDGFWWKYDPNPPYCMANTFTKHQSRELSFIPVSWLFFFFRSLPLFLVLAVHSPF